MRASKRHGQLACRLRPLRGVCSRNCLTLPLCLLLLARERMERLLRCSAASPIEALVLVAADSI